MTRTEKVNPAFAERAYNFMSFWLIMVIAGVLMFFGAMWFTNGIDIVARYAASGVVTLLVLEKLFQRLK